MKKIFAFILIAFCISSCYKVYIDKPQLEPAFFYDEYAMCDTVIFNMACNVYQDSVQMHFIKRSYFTKDKYNVSLFGEDYSINKYYVVLLEEEYKYYPDNFKRMLLQKNKNDREGIGFMFSANMGMTWDTFDKMYNKYINEK